MSVVLRQAGLFDGLGGVDPAEAAAARARMRGMIERLVGATVAPWANEMGVILDDGSFRRAMRLVPDGEAQALWAEFDAQMERVYAIFAAGRAARGE